MSRQYLAASAHRVLPGQRMIGITLGDPAGIGPEVLLKALCRTGWGDFVVLGDEDVLRRTAKRLGLRIPAGLKVVTTAAVGDFAFGAIQRRCGKAALAALEKAVELVRAGELGGIVTAPVSKQALRQAGFGFPGQTEFLASRLRVAESAMMVYAAASSRSPGLRVVLVSTHLPLAQVGNVITADAVARKIRILREFLCRSEGLKQPRIAVLALNPHGREFTSGEEARIARGIRMAGDDSAGPFPADSIGPLLAQYDGVVAMYHDQAMIPAKLLAQGQGVNVTLGLPVVRTSPLHGTAFDIAGQGIAAPDSMVAAIRACRRFLKQQMTDTGPLGNK